MRLADVPEVLQIERLSFSTPWPQQAFEQELKANRLATYLVVRTEDRVVAFGGVWLMVDEAHITTFSVHPDWRRQRVGARLLLALVERSVQLGAARMTLEVRVSNEAAQALYRRFGFTVAGRRPAYYSDDGEDAYMMSTPALGGPEMAAVQAEWRGELQADQT